MVKDCCVSILARSVGTTNDRQDAGPTGCGGADEPTVPCGVSNGHRGKYVTEFEKRSTESS